MSINTTAKKSKRSVLERVYRVRLANVRILRKGYTSNAEFARALGVSHPFISHVIGENPIRQIGEELARGIEQKLGLAQGRLDYPL